MSSILIMAFDFGARITGHESIRQPELRRQHRFCKGHLMIRIRVTAKVAKRLNAPLAPESNYAPNNKLGDWYVNLIVVQRKHLLLAVSERTLLPALIPAKDLKSFPTRFPDAVSNVLRSLEIPDTAIKGETLQMKEWVIAKTASRQILGSMNDFGNLLKAYWEPRTPLEKLSLRLGTTPCGPLGMSNPIHVTAALFGVKPPGHLFSFDFYSSKPNPRPKPHLMLVKDENDIKSKCST